MFGKNKIKIIKETIDESVVKAAVNKFFNNRLKEIEAKEDDIKEKLIEIHNEKKRIEKIEDKDLKSKIEIDEKLNELKEQYNQYLRLANNDNDKNGIEAQNINHTIKFINEWLLKN